MSDIVELLSELQLSSRGTRGENLSNIFPGFLRCLHISDVAEHLVMHTGREAVQHSTRSFFPYREVLVC